MTTTVSSPADLNRTIRSEADMEPASITGCVRGQRIPFPKNALIHELIEQQTKLSPDATAIVCGDDRVTYRELNTRAENLAQELRRIGVGADIPVGLCAQRSLEMMVGLLGILKSGGCYLPLDPAYPAERVSFMLEDAKPPILLTQSAIRDRLGSDAASLQILNIDQLQLDQGNAGSNSAQISSDSLAYVIYTSGSTGKPKGVMVTHRNVMNFFAAMDEVLNFGSRPSGTWLAVTSMCFDISVLELFWTLARGFTVVIRRENDASVSEQILKHRCTHFQCTPSLAGSLIRERFAAPALQQLDTFLVGGEALPAALASQLRDLLRGELINMYGPTETTVWSATYRVSKVGNSVPIGKPIGNTNIYLLNEHLESVENGESGEIFIGGDGVTRGYLHRPDLTAEKFVRVEEDRAYRTGDIGRLRADGEIEFLGRADQQVKLNGHRIELGEIEAALRRVPGIRDAAVRIWEFAPDDKRLAAYVIAEPSRTISAEELRAPLKASLPDYMIPSSFTFLEKFPLTPNGKLDRKALPKPEQKRPNLQAEFVAPQNAVEENIARIWRELLRIETVGTRDNFFDLGGTSLLVAEMQVRLRGALNVDIPIIRLFEHPTISKLAEFIASRNNPALTGARERAQRQRNLFARRQSHALSA